MITKFRKNKSFSAFCMIILIVMVSIFFISCSNNNDDENLNTATATNDVNNAVTAKPNDPNLAMNPLTGLTNMNKDNVGKRPLAITINNLKKATPQYGIGSADLYYEVVAEGGITRILAMFSDIDKMPAQVGPVRSARHYYVDFSQGHDAIFTHYGSSTIAEDLIDNADIDDIDGMVLSKVFWRDPELKKQRGTEHSVLTSGEKLWQHIIDKKYRVDSKLKNANAFDFNSLDNIVVPKDKVATSVTIPFSGYVTSTFTYDANTKTYSKGQFDAPHIDAITNKPITVTNVFVLFTEIHVVNKNNRLVDVNLTNGDGFYISTGGAMPIKWSKGGTFDPLKFTDVNGKALSINAGKSYINFVGASKVDTVEIK